jgi:hypothetical protein
MTAPPSARKAKRQAHELVMAGHEVLVKSFVVMEGKRGIIYVWGLACGHEDDDGIRLPGRRWKALNCLFRSMRD